jgi:hypothetical protein
MKREVLARLDITGATDTLCAKCLARTAMYCPWIEFPVQHGKRAVECLRAEKEANPPEVPECEP